MSGLTVSRLTPLTGGKIDIASGDTLRAAGMVAQTVVVRNESRTSQTAEITGDGTALSGLGITITPKFSSSIILLQWMINLEVVDGWDSVFTILRDGAIITTSNQQGYNNGLGNVRYSGIAPGSHYDHDNGTTQTNIFLQYFNNAVSTATTTFTPAIRSSSAATHAIYLNRCVNSATGTTSAEISVSMGIAMEVMT